MKSNMVRKEADHGEYHNEEKLTTAQGDFGIAESISTKMKLTVIFFLQGQAVINRKISKLIESTLTWIKINLHDKWGGGFPTFDET